MSQNLQRALLGMVIGALFGAVFAWMQLMEAKTLEVWELAFVDWRYRRFADPERTRDEILVVQISERTIDELARNDMFIGYNRTLYTALVESLRILGARTVVIDVTMKSRSAGVTLGDDLEAIIQASGTAVSLRPEDEEFAAALSTAGNVTIGIDAPYCAPKDGTSWDLCRKAQGQFDLLVPYLERSLVPANGELKARFDASPDKPHLEFPYALVLPFVRSVGIVNTRHTQRGDTSLRLFAPFVEVDRWTVPDFGVAAFAVAMDGRKPSVYSPGDPLPEPEAIPRLPAATFAARHVEIAGRQVPIDESGYTWIRWRGNWLHDDELLKRKLDATPLFTNYQHLVFGELDQVKGLDLNAFRDKIVLIGYTAQGESADFVSTPFGSQPGVFRHAAVIDTLLSQEWLRKPSRTVEAIITLVLAMASGALVLGLPLFAWQEVRGPLGPAVMAIWKFAPGAVLMASYAAIATFAFGKGWIVSILHPELAMAVVTAFATAFAYVFTRREREEARRRSEQAVALAKRTLPGAIVDEIMAKEGHVNLGGDRFTLTVYFSDIAGFTSISERMEPEELVSVLNEYLTRVTERLVGHGAIIDKYIGDAVMAFWGAPIKVADGPVKSCLAALEAIEVIEAFSRELVARGLTPLKTRIGINTGPAIAGGVGHRDYKYNYTAMGDTVNLASRLEGANKAYGTTCMLGPDTYEGAKDVVLARELDLVKVKGKKIPVRVYELMGRASATLPEKRRIKERYESALALYRSREFAAARAAFASLAEELDDPPSRTMIVNCEERLATPPPADWDGSNELHEK